MSLTNLRHSSMDKSRGAKSLMQEKSLLSARNFDVNHFNKTSASAFMSRISNESVPSFIFKSFDIPGEDKKAIDYERLLKKPKHKPVGQKFDKTSISQERSVSVLTKEDHFNKFDMPWISRLRIKDNAELAKLSNDKKFEATAPMPPSFYENDLSKARKFTNLHNVDID